jgi:hypothetical protein
MNPNKAFIKDKNPAVEMSMVCHHCAAPFTVSVPADIVSITMFLTCTVCSWINMYNSKYDGGATWEKTKPELQSKPSSHALNVKANLY